MVEGSVRDKTADIVRHTDIVSHNGCDEKRSLQEEAVHHLKGNINHFSWHGGSAYEKLWCALTKIHPLGPHQVFIEPYIYSTSFLLWHGLKYYRISQAAYLSRRTKRTFSEPLHHCSDSMRWKRRTETGHQKFMMRFGFWDVQWREESVTKFTSNSSIRCTTNE